MGLRESTHAKWPQPAWYFLFLVASLSLPVVLASDDLPARRMLEEGSTDAPAMAAALRDTFIGEKEWEKEVERFWGKFQDWEKDSGGDVGRYLNDRLVIVGLSATGGKVEKIKKAIAWLAMYKEFDEDAPRSVAKFIREHRESLILLFTDFTWEKASAYIKTKQWRKDAAEGKRLASAAKP